VLKGLEQVAEMIRKDPYGEWCLLYRDGKPCLGYMDDSGTLYYAPIREVSLASENAGE